MIDENIVIPDGNLRPLSSETVFVGKTILWEVDSGLIGDDNETGGHGVKIRPYEHDFAKTPSLSRTQK
jgi:hypothetical protein